MDLIPNRILIMCGGEREIQRR